jgi:hypothetical protein
MAGELVTVPDFLRDWPWKGHLNKNYEEAKALSLEWITGFGAFDPTSQNAFDRCDFGMHSRPLFMRRHLWGHLLTISSEVGDADIST